MSAVLWNVGANCDWMPPLNDLYGVHLMIVEALGRDAHYPRVAEVYSAHTLNLLLTAALKHCVNVVKSMRNTQLLM